MNFISIIILNLTLILRIVSSNPSEGIGVMEFIMSSTGKDLMKVSFVPGDGRKLRQSYEKKYGTKGKELIQMLGSGSEVMDSGSTVFTTNVLNSKKGKEEKKKIKGK